MREFFSNKNLKESRDSFCEQTKSFVRDGVVQNKTNNRQMTWIHQ